MKPLPPAAAIGWICAVALSTATPRFGAHAADGGTASPQDGAAPQDDAAPQDGAASPQDGAASSQDSATRLQDKAIALSMARELERKLPVDRPEARVPLADWLWSKGLHEQALAQLDRVLAADSDQKYALALLQRWEPALGVLGARSRAEIPAATRAQPAAYLQQAAALPPAVREIALARLAQTAEPTALRGAAHAALTQRDPALRATAALLLRRADPRAELPALLDRAVLDTHLDVRSEAARTLAAAGVPDVVAPCVKALSSRHEIVRAQAAEALGRLGFASAVEPLVHALSAPPSAHGALASPSFGSSPAANSAANPGATGSIYSGTQTAYIRDYDVELATGASITDPIVDVMHDGAQLDARVLGVTQNRIRGPVSSAITAALARLTRQDLGQDPAAWLKWWDVHGATWTVAQMPKTAATAPTTPRTGS
jgi:hypothetical protein